MERLPATALRSLAAAWCAAVLAACAPQPASPLAATPTPPAEATTAANSATPAAAPTTTASPTLPSPTPTATPLPLTLGLASAGQLQVVGEVEIYGQGGNIFAGALSPDGRLAAMAGCLAEGEDMECHGTTLFRLFDTASGEALPDPVYLSPAIEQLAFSPDGSVLAAAGCDISLWIYGLMDTVCDLPRVWLIDTASGDLIAELEGYTSHVTDFAFAPDGSVLYTAVIYSRNDGDGDHVIRAYDPRTGEKLVTIETGMINCTEMLLDISADGRTLVGNVTSPCGTQSFVGWWDVSDLGEPVRIGNVPGYGRSRLSPDGTQILVHNLKDHTLRRYELATGNSLGLVPNVPGQSNLSTFEYLNDSQTVLLNLGSEYAVVDLASGEVIRRILPEAGGALRSFLLTPDRGTLIRTFYGEDLAVEFIDLASWESQIIPFDPYNSWFWQYSFSPRQMVFLPDGTGMIGWEGGVGSIRFQRMGFPDPGQPQAVQALRDYFDLLAAGEYDTAAQRIIDSETVALQAGNAPFYPEAPLSLLVEQMPGLDPDDPAAILATLCQDPAFPCLPVREVLFPARLAEGVYRFTVTFSLPDGSLADWPPCAGVPADHFCWHRGGEFEYYVLLDPDGGARIVEGLPPAASLHTD